jgi:protein TonB
MFEQMILSEPPTRKRWTVLLAFAGQIALIGILIVIPMLTVQALPLETLTAVLVAPPPPPPPPPPPAPASVAPRVAHVVIPRVNPHALFAPKTVPKTIATVPDLPQAPVEAAEIAGVPGGVPGGVAGGVVGGVLAGVLGAAPSVAPPPPPPPPAKPAAAPAAPKVIRVGGQVEAAKVISAPPPVYPVLAKDARVWGEVKLDAIIGTDGHIEDLKVISGPPLLIEAAMDAVKKWTYQPTILNGQPFKVETLITVNFQLG